MVYWGHVLLKKLCPHYSGRSLLTTLVHSHLLTTLLQLNHCKAFAADEHSSVLSMQRARTHTCINCWAVSYMWSQRWYYLLTHACTVHCVLQITDSLERKAMPIVAGGSVLCMVSKRYSMHACAHCICVHVHVCWCIYTTQQCPSAYSSTELRTHSAVVERCTVA
jgi:hypothetical protein